MAEDEATSADPENVEAKGDGLLDPPNGPAEGLVREAMQELDPAKRKRLLEAALAADPGSIVARVKLADFAATPAEAMEILRAASGDALDALESAEAAEDLAEGDARVQAAGRTRAAVVDMIVAYSQRGFTAYAEGLLDEARDAFEMLLAVVPNDLANVRGWLLACHLELDDLEEARELLEDYEDDRSAAWRFGAALLALKERPDDPASFALLEQAAAELPFAAEMLIRNDFERPVYAAEQRAARLAEASETAAKAFAATFDEAVACGDRLFPVLADMDGVRARLAECVFAAGLPRPWSMRIRPELPPVRTETWRAQLSAAPQDADAVWRFESRRLRTWLRKEGGIVRGWLTLVADGTAKDFRSYLVHAGEPTAETLLEALAEAVLAPVSRRPTPAARPGKVGFGSILSAAGAEVVGELRSVGIEPTEQVCELPADLLQAIDELDRTMTRPQPPALVAVEGLSPAERKSFFAAAAVCLKQAPWRKLLAQDLLLVEGIGAGGAWRRAAAAVGGGGPGVGVAVFLEPGAPGGELDEAVTVDYTSFHHLAIDDYDEAVDVHGLTFPDESWPLVVRRGALDETMPPSVFDVEATTVCLHAAAAFADVVGAARRRPLKLKVEFGGRMVEASARLQPRK